MGKNGANKTDDLSMEIYNGTVCLHKTNALL